MRSRRRNPAPYEHPASGITDERMLRLACVGMCGEFAVALHRVYGYPLAAFFEVGPDGYREGDFTLAHAFAKHPSRKVVDSRGVRPKTEMKAELLASGGKLQEHPTTEGDIDALSMSGLDADVLAHAEDYVRTHPEIYGPNAGTLRRNPAPYGYEEMLRLVRSTLTTPDETIKVHQIGKGAFAVAYVEDNVPAGRIPRVFVVVNDDVYDKELLAMAHESEPRNPHLPAVERFGYLPEKSVFAMPLYRAPLRKTDSPEGWRDYTLLKKCRDKVYAHYLSRRKSGYEINEDVYACAEAAGVRPKVLDALRVLIDTASNYGAEYVFEFSPRNLATDEAGNLILLDVLYDREALTRLRREAATRRGGGW